MKNVAIIAAKELRSYAGSPMAYVVAAVFLALGGSSFVMYLVGTDYSDSSIRGFLAAGQYLVMLFAAVLTMRLIAEERKLGTWEMLLGAPVRDIEIVLGKFVSALAVLSTMLALTFYYPILLLVLGDPDLGPMCTGYLGLFLLACASLAAGIFATSLTSNQIVSAVVAVGILFGLWSIGLVADLVQGAGGKVLSTLSLSTYFPDFVKGIVDTQAVVYYLSVTAVFLYLATSSIETARWR